MIERREESIACSGTAPGGKGAPRRLASYPFAQDFRARLVAGPVISLRSGRCDNNGQNIEETPWRRPARPRSRHENEPPKRRPKPLDLPGENGDISALLRQAAGAQRLAEERLLGRSRRDAAAIGGPDPDRRPSRPARRRSRPQGQADAADGLADRRQSAPRRFCARGGRRARAGLTGAAAGGHATGRETSCAWAGKGRKPRAHGWSKACARSGKRPCAAGLRHARRPAVARRARSKQTNL